MLKANTCDKIGIMKKEIKCPKCKWDIKVKSGKMKGKQRYLCKKCGCKYTGGRNGYPEEVKIEAIRYYLEGIGFRRIERLLGVSHVSVINWVKKAANNLREEEKSSKKADVLELDEMCVNFKKTFGCGQQ